MSTPVAPEPVRIDTVAGVWRADLPAPEHLGLRSDGCSERQRGGRAAALATLESFLRVRGMPYRRAMS
ncbi:hypothetical protein ACKI2C_50940, partial [Streptomyces brasiliscabiei]|uniref:hypothetical protein n=1 Tax=Streptomyces brasiliscabiei TaxID=2736302 RepID=UPI0038F6340A